MREARSRSYRGGWKSHRRPCKSVVPEIPAALDQVVSRCLEPDPAKRYQTTQELAEALDRLNDKGERIPRQARGRAAAVRRGRRAGPRAARRHLVVRARTGRTGAARASHRADRRLPEPAPTIRRSIAPSSRCSSSRWKAPGSSPRSTATDRPQPRRAAARETRRGRCTADRGEAGRSESCSPVRWSAKAAATDIASKASQAVTGEVIANVSGGRPARTRCWGWRRGWRRTFAKRSATTRRSRPSSSRWTACRRLLWMSCAITRRGWTRLHSNKFEEALRNFQTAVEAGSEIRHRLLAASR